MANFLRNPANTNDNNDWHGDDVSCDKDNDNIRLMFHNVNGLSVHGTDGIDMFANEQRNLQVDAQCFSEHCLDTTKYQVYQSAKDTLRQHLRGHQTSIQLDSSSEPALNVYKPGGTGILLIGELVSRQDPQGKGGDALGRWSYIHLRRKDKAPVTIISAYQVCPRPTNPIGNTAYHQQVRALNAVGRYNVHPRHAFIRDLSTFIGHLTTQGHDIILGGDFNETLDDKHSGLLQLVSSNNLVDPFTSKFPHIPMFGTHTHGRRRIDAVFITPSLLRSIIRIGYAPFQYTNTSDHRPLLLDLDRRQLFGQAHNILPSVHARGIQSKDKKAVSQFITQWYDAISQEGVFALISSLENDTASPEVVEHLDALVGKAGNIAEQSCKRRRPEFYSQQLVQQRIQVSILRGHLNALRAGKDRSGQLRRRMERCGIDVPLPPTPRLTFHALRDAQDALQKTRQDHVAVRHAELMEKIETAASNGKKTRAKILRSIKTVETNRQTYQILKSIQQRSNSSNQIDRIEIPASWPPVTQPVESTNALEDPKTCTVWRTVTEPHEVEYYLMMRNRLHFGQAEGTPFTQPPLSIDLDWSASTMAAEDILLGRYSSMQSHSDATCEALLRSCTATATLDSMSAEISHQEFRDKMTHWRESTTTSPSGRHLGRYKALFAPGRLNEEEEPRGAVMFQTKQESLMSLIVAIINYCIRHNYVLSRWKKIVNVMIFKEQGNFKIHRLRIIHLYEADFNLLLAVKWRQLVHSANTRHLLNTCQYGGRPGCEAQSLTLLEELKYDLAYLTRRTLINFDNDASSCYDRIVVPFASLINRKYGLHRKVAAVHASTLQQAQFHLKTPNGLSEISYTPSARFPIHGTGQGSGNSPMIWLLISSTLFDLHQEMAHGAHYITPDGNLRISFSMVGFVDDSTGTCNDFRPQSQVSTEELLQRMAHDAQTWNDLLYCSGGKLELPKCSFHVLSFQFRPHGQPIPQIDKFDNSITILDSVTTQQIPIPAKRVFEYHKTLGHFKSPSSNRNKELQNLQEKAHRSALLISTSPVTRHGAFLAYQTIYVPSVQYVLPQSFFTKKDLDRAQASSLQKIIAKCGYNRNTARALIFAPQMFAGGGFLPWHLLQGEGQVKTFLKHWRTDTVVSKTLRVTIAWAQWQSGHGQPILEDIHFHLPHLECRWLSSLRSFLRHINARIQLDQSFVLLPERRHDLHIMEYAVRSRLFNDADLQVLNYCRLYLHITTVSEMFNVEGTHLLPDIFHCRREAWFDPSTVITLQKRPSPYHIRHRWQKFCRQWAQGNGTIAESFQFGQWLVQGNKLRRRRQSYYEDEDVSIIYHWKEGCYWAFRSDNHTCQCYIPSHPTNWEPTGCCRPLDVEVQQDGSLRVSAPLRKPLYRIRPQRSATTSPGISICWMSGNASSSKGSV